MSLKVLAVRGLAVLIGFAVGMKGYNMFKSSGKPAGPAASTGTLGA